MRILGSGGAGILLIHAHTPSPRDILSLLFFLSFFSSRWEKIHVTLTLVAILDRLLVLHRFLWSGGWGSDGFNRGRWLHGRFCLDALYGFRCRDGFRCWRYIHWLLGEALVRVVYWKEISRNTRLNVIMIEINYILQFLLYDISYVWELSRLFHLDWKQWLINIILKWMECNLLRVLQLINGNLMRSHKEKLIIVDG